MPPKRSTAAATAASTCSSKRTSQGAASAWPPAASISAAALWIGPGSFGLGVSLLPVITILAPSRANRRAIALPMPRLPPLMNMVLPANLSIRFAPRTQVDNRIDERLPCAQARQVAKPRSRQGTLLKAHLMGLDRDGPLPTHSSPHYLDRQRDTLAAADAEGDDASGQAIAAHGVDQPSREDGPGGADRMTMGDRPAFDIDDFFRQAQFARHRDRDRGERLGEL